MFVSSLFKCVVCCSLVFLLLFQHCCLFVFVYVVVCVSGLFWDMCFLLCLFMLLVCVLSVVLLFLN